MNGIDYKYEDVPLAPPVGSDRSIENKRLLVPYFRVSYHLHFADVIVSRPTNCMLSELRPDGREPGERELDMLVNGPGHDKL